MPSKKTKFNARFPPARIKKIMQTDDEVGKVAAPVPVLISKALELFVESLLTKASEQTQAKQARTLTTSHIKQCIHREKKFDFLKDLVENVPDLDKEKSSASDTTQTERHRKGRGKKRKRKQPVDEEEEDDITSDEDSSISQDHSFSQESSGSHHLSEPSSSFSESLTQESSSFSSSPYQPSWSSSTTLPLPPHNAAMSNPEVAGVMGFSHPSRSKQEEDDDEDYDA